MKSFLVVTQSTNLLATPLYEMLKVHNLIGVWIYHSVAVKRRSGSLQINHIVAK